MSQPTFDQAYAQPAPNSSKGSWLARVSHRASHIPNKPLNLPKSASRETLPLRTPGSGGFAGSRERLPQLQKTHSYPTSPTSPQSPASPIDSEFGTTPIDASFGERVEPPERPAPERPTYLTSDRATLPSQKSRSRSGTATQAGENEVPVERKGAKKGRAMDKYARQAGDESYDSDGEADDEFERSVFTSPTLPTHYADDEESHPSESEDDHETVDGEDTPTTQGWGDNAGSIEQWSEEQVAEYLASLSPALKQYTQVFKDEGINGEALRSLHHDELRELGVASVGHRLTILKAVYEQKLRSGVKVEEGDYVPLSAEGEKGELNATQDDISRIIDSIRLRDQRIIAAEAELMGMRQSLDRIAEENRKLREETLPIMRLVKDQRTPLPDPAGGTIPSPRDAEVPKPTESSTLPKESKIGSGLSRKFSTKKLFLGGAPKQPSPTHPPAHTPQPREVRDDSGAHLEASAAAMAASSHLTASMTSQASPNSVHGQQLSPTSPAYSTQAPSSGGSYQAASRSFQRERDRYDSRSNYGGHDDTGTGYSSNTQTWSNASTVVADQPSARSQDRSRRQAPTPSPREDESQPGSGGSRSERYIQSLSLDSEIIRVYYTYREVLTDGDVRDNPQVEIFKSFRVGIEDPCRVVLPVVRSTLPTLACSSDIARSLPLAGSQTLQHHRRLAPIRPVHRARRPRALPRLGGEAFALV